MLTTSNFAMVEEGAHAIGAGLWAWQGGLAKRRNMAGMCHRKRGKPARMRRNGADGRVYGCGEESG